MITEASNFISTEKIFWGCALIGSLFFVIKAVMLLIGGIDADIDADDAYADVDSAEGTEDSFSVLSFTSVSGFLMVFGWTGLACFKQHGLSIAVSTVIAFGGGVAFMYLIAYLFRLMLKFTDPGDTFEVEKIVGEVAEVYQQIPESGAGKVQITVNGVMRELQAISESKEAIESFTKVKICSAVDGETVSVKPVS